MLKKLYQYWPISSWCYYCADLIVERSTNKFFCNSCLSSLSWFPANTCGLCLQEHLDDKNYCWHSEEWGLNSVFAVFDYQLPAVKWFLSLKFSASILAGRVFLSLLATYLESAKLNLTDYDYILPVPSTKKKILDLVPGSTLVLGDYFNKQQFKPELIRKIKSTPRQATLNKFWRQKNMAANNIFEVSPQVADKNILLFDDVCTTGATVRNICRQLNKFKVKRVDLLCIFRERPPE